MNTAPIVSRVWNFCHTLRDDGVGYGDYLEQLTYLIFLKMADEYAKPPYNRDVGVPGGCDWNSLTSRRGAELEAHYVMLLRKLGEQKGMLGQIFTKSQNKITDPAKLYRLIDMVDSTNWVMLGADVKGDIYEDLLERNAADIKSGAGETIRRKLLHNTDLHTILRLPTGIFYAQGVKANVIFFDNRPASPDPQTSKVWYYDYRTNVHHTLKQKPMTYDHLRDFVDCYNPMNRHIRKETWSEDSPDGRWRTYSREELLQRDKASLDVFWLKDASMTDLDNLPEPDVLAEEIMEHLRSALDSFDAVKGNL